MQSENKMNSTIKSDTTRNSVISVKVSKAEKEELQEMADDLELSLSEFMRLKGLSTVATTANHEQVIREQEEEIKKYKIALSLYDGHTYNPPGISLRLNNKQKQMLIDLFHNYFKDDKPVEHQIIRYLIEDVFTVHHDLEKKVVYDLNLKGHEVLACTRNEYPYYKSSNADELLNAFRDYSIHGIRNLKQVKFPEEKSK